MLFGAHLSTAGDLPGLPKRARDIGCDAVQFFAGNPRGWQQKVYTKEEGERFQAACKEQNMIPFIHMLYLTSYGTTDEALRRKSIDGLGNMLTTGTTLGCIGVVTHLGSHKGDGFDSRVQALADGLLEAVEIDKGGSCYAVLENSAGAGGNMGNSFEELAEIFKRTGRHPRIKFCLDTAHMFTSGIDFRTKAGCDKMLDDFDRLIGLEHLVVMHINDSKADFDTHRDRHENIGDGYIGRDGFKAILTHPKLKTIPGILEVPGLEGKGPDKANLDRLRAIVKDA
ncbi:MAG TPA: deoxyribonuclease IV [Candidatus Saccharimonadales bacterium]|nr:deoxyribonuclease IV [Candidatus Saccharimonadales bacterium]